MDTFSKLTYLAFGLLLIVKGLGILWLADGFFSTESALGSLLVAAALVVLNLIIPSER